MNHKHAWEPYFMLLMFSYNSCTNFKCNCSSIVIYMKRENEREREGGDRDRELESDNVRGKWKRVDKAREIKGRNCLK